jgi:methionyl-tRNA formyltransferase
MKIAILTTKNQWFESCADALSKKLGNIPIFNNHVDIKSNYDVIFILSYHEIIPQEYLKKSKHNLVVHESALPKGKGWAPLFWQVLEGKNEIPFTMIEASESVDGGSIYMQENLKLIGNELNAELRHKQAELTIKMCLKFINNYEKYKTPVPQSGDESFYRKRNKKDSELDVDKTIKDQFSLLRLVDNESYPAFFNINGKKYKIMIYKNE